LFTKILKKVVDNVDGGIAAVVMGLDGIPVETYVRSDGRVDVNTIAMEFSFVLNQIRKAADSLQVGACEEVSVRVQNLTLAVRMLSPIYFIAVVLAPEANSGKCRFLMRLAAPQLTAQL
jgi:predicted regulator of Ras-like GTPase activity (Roadblock/LC7/MglB family)